MRMVSALNPVLVLRRQVKRARLRPFDRWLLPSAHKLCVSTEEGNERTESRLEASYLDARLRLRNGDDLRNHESLQHRSLVAASWSNTRTLRRISLMPSPLSKSALIESIAKLQTDGTSKRQVKSVVEARRRQGLLHR
jgi:hypothetical protein